MKQIPYGKQHITDADIESVLKVLKSDFLTQGPYILDFEKAFAKYVGAKYAVAVANGTAALHLCTLALNIKPEDKVITTPITFAASANCVRYCGGEVVFADIDPDTYLLDINKVRQLLESAPKGSYKGIIPVDFAGRAVDLEAFRELADEYDCWIIEDACHAPGGFFVDKNGERQYCGNGKFADLAIFSFHPVKHIACGEGGMITTNNEFFYKKLLMLRTHGITKEHSTFTNSLELALGLDDLSQTALDPSFPGWYMEMQELGFNYRLTDFQAALGLSQMARSEEGLKRRIEIARKYDDVFHRASSIISHSGVVAGHAYHLYVIQVHDRIGLYNYLRSKNVMVQIHYVPCHLMPYYRQMGWKQGDLPKAETYYKYCMSLPMYPSLTEEEQDFVIDEIMRFFHE